MDAAVAPFLEPAVEGAQAETSVEHLTELIESGWVDTTATGYSLTARGATALERLSIVVTEQRTIFARGVSDEEYRATIDVLERVARNLGWSDTN